MNRYQIYYKSLYKKSDWPQFIESDSYHVHTVRDPGYMTDTVSFYKKADSDSFCKDKILVASIQHVEHVVLVDSIPPVPHLVPGEPGVVPIVNRARKPGWFRFMSVTKNNQ